MTNGPVRVGDAELYLGDVLSVLAEMPDGLVHCVVTSPPYWGLRDYGIEPQTWPGGWRGSLGREPTIELYVEHMTTVFREVRRVLRSDGTCWLNLGDCYNGTNGRSPSIRDNGTPSFRSGGQGKGAPGLKAKDLCMIPARVALALQADGWWLRSEIVWAKPNPMPESTKDRPTSAHEKVFLLSKSARYFYDAEAVREAAIGLNDHDLSGQGYAAPGQSAQSGSRKSKKPNGWDTGAGAHGAFHRGGREKGGAGEIRSGRNLRNVWTIATAPYPDAHFATFPPKLVRPCIKAGCPEGGTVLDPFGGSGTTAKVALSHRRKAILIEINPEYRDLAIRRLGLKDDEPDMFIEPQAKEEQTEMRGLDDGE